MTRVVFVFGDPLADSYDLSTAAKVLRQAAPEVQTELISAVVQPDSARIRDRARMVEVFSLFDRNDEIKEPALEILRDYKTDQRSFRVALESLISACGNSVTNQLVEALDDSRIPASFRFNAADELASIGALSSAVELWAKLLTVPMPSPMDCFIALNRLINTGHRERAIDALKDLLTGGLCGNHREAALARGFLAWAMLSDPASTFCICGRRNAERCNDCFLGQ
ncbi:hypothetical protein ACFWD7_51530 [Streptomyces mirabilis]|uniref:hypothetical protein n=1 Tax=Streptomyces mirabilis TaxID=68239 RepID=UPI0021C0CBA3|nr:hypothetical protein [Streptomyces mirabilis]MCT9113855.1 hypothetical protein [Streptomyces mirabilis]